MSPETNQKLTTGITALILTTLLLFLQPVSADNNLVSIRIESLLDLNAILITQVDVVFVYDQELADRLPTTKGDWYTFKYELSGADAAKLDIVTTDIPQGFYAQDLNLPERSSSAVKVFTAAYHQSLATRLRDITGLESVQIQIDEFGIVVSE